MARRRSKRASAPNRRGPPAPDAAAATGRHRSSSTASSWLSRWSSGTPRSIRRRWWPPSYVPGSRLRGGGRRLRRGRPRGRPRWVGPRSRPKVRARKNRVSVSVDPSISGYSDGSTAIIRSRFTSWNPASDPLCIHNHRPYRNGWQLLRCTGVPLEARTWANSSGVRICPATSRRSWSFQAGWVLLNTAGVVRVAVPSDAEAVTVRGYPPSWACRLWSMIECAGRNSSSSARIGSPE